MFLVNRQICVARIVAVIFIIGTTQVSYARTVMMEVVREEFKQKTGKRWEEATIEEKKDFMEGYHKREEEEIWKGREREYLPSTDTQATDKQDNLLQGNTLEVRKLFLTRKGKDWDEATPQEQREFLTEFREKKGHEEESRQTEREAERQRLEAKDRQRQAEKERREEVRKAEEAGKLAEKERLREKREREREKLKAGMERLRQLEEQK